MLSSIRWKGSKMELERKFKWCLEKGKKAGRKHRGIRKVKLDKSEAQNHIAKAIHNLKAVEYNLKGDFEDWAVSAAFYAMYHSLLAILRALGYESRNQECSINAVEYFIKTKKIDFDAKYIAMIRRAEELRGGNAKTLREEFQYGTEVEVDKEILESLRANSKEFVEAAQVLIEKI